MGNKTGLYQRHIDAGAKIVDFGGWDMPLHYGSQIDEHHVVRKAAGIFDVSHMTVVDVQGADSRNWLQYLLANDVAKLAQIGKGLYSCMLNADGGVIDDLIVYWQGDDRYRVIVNAATRSVDLAWMQDRIEGRDVQLTERSDLGMLAVQGPAARELAAPLVPGDLGQKALQLKPFESLEQDDVFVARTGYTGEDGWEILLDSGQVPQFWDNLVAAGIRPCGLGARDTLRLEAGLNLYGQDMTAETTPLESNLSWTIAWEPAEREFVGRDVLEQQRQAGPSRRLVGLVLEDRGVMRTGQAVRTLSGEGEVVSGGFSPTMQRSIALARIPVGEEDSCEVQIRKDLKPARIVRPPFVRNGEIKVL